MCGHERVPAGSGSIEKVFYDVTADEITTPNQCDSTQQPNPGFAAQVLKSHHYYEEVQRHMKNRLPHHQGDIV
jgi:hypothetical protein